MTGDKHIISMRMSGVVPEWVFVNDYPCIAPTDDKHPNLCIHGDDIESLDLRFLVNLRVSIGSASESRCKAILEACKRHQASLVAVAQTSCLGKEGFTEIWTNGISS
jgi:hypothetical protein